MSRIQTSHRSGLRFSARVNWHFPSSKRVSKTMILRTAAIVSTARMVGGINGVKLYGDAGWIQRYRDHRNLAAVATVARSAELRPDYADTMAHRPHS